MQGSLCYFDGLTNLEGRHGTKPLPFDGSGSAHPKGTSRLVLVIRGRANRNYRESVNKIYFEGRGVSSKAADSGNGGWAPVLGWKSNPVDKVDHEQAENQKEERRKEKRERAAFEEAKRVAFEAEMVADRELHEAKKVAEDAVTKAALMELLEQPAAEKAKEAGALTCRVCYGKYTDARDSGGGSKKNYGFCSRTCRAAAKGKCDHGRRKRQCKDCGTGYCAHGRRKVQCKDCGTGHCEHGRQRDKCQLCK
jgi:hypothetical protein